jgi:hypothetical protein
LDARAKLRPFVAISLVLLVATPASLQAEGGAGNPFVPLGLTATKTHARHKRSVHVEPKSETLPPLPDRNPGPRVVEAEATADQAQTPAPPTDAATEQVQTPVGPAEEPGALARNNPFVAPAPTVPAEGKMANGESQPLSPLPDRNPGPRIVKSPEDETQAPTERPWTPVPPAQTSTEQTEAQAKEAGALDRKNPFSTAAPMVAPASTVATGESDAELPPLPERSPSAAVKTAEATPAANPETHPVPPSEAPTIPWTDAEIRAGKADCAKALAALQLDYEALPPIKQGICGASAPIRVKSIGSDPKVAIEPPAIMNCRLAVAVAVWLRKIVEPAAQAEFGAPVVKLHNAASYDCRNRYGNPNAPLSEHALANALDVSEFDLASGEHITVLKSWPRVATSDPPPAPAPKPSRLAEATGSILPASSTKVGAKTAPAIVKAKASPELPLPPAEAKPPEQPLAERESEFVHEVHDDACKMFGTVLGPAANEAHKNHFHLDMKMRRYVNICE